MYYLLIIMLWFAVTVTYFHKELTLFFTREKRNDGMAVNIGDANDIMGVSQAVFLPKREENIVLKDDDFEVLKDDDFEVKYEVEEEQGDVVPLDGENTQAPAIVSFDEMREAVLLVAEKGVDILNTSDIAVNNARKTFRLLEETELLAKMLSGRREVSERIEMLMNGK
jgi:hypothetical protein